MWHTPPHPPPPPLGRSVSSSIQSLPLGLAVFSCTCLCCVQDANQSVPEALTKFGTHVKKKEHKLYGAFAKDVDMDKKSTKTTFDDSDDE